LLKHKIENKILQQFET